MAVYTIAIIAVLIVPLVYLYVTHKERRASRQ
jgi:hypothetical protein